MLRLFILLNARLWWRSLKGMELAAILFYGFFVLLLAGQIAGVLLLMLFSPEADVIQEIYPQITEEVHLFIHLVFLNILWLNQIFFTKINRLPVHENRKLLSFGMPLKKLAMYQSIAGFFHPFNMIFHVLWILYLSSAAPDIQGWFIGLLLIVANYTLIHSIKWRFRLRAAKKFGRTAAYIIGMLILVFFLINNMELPDYSDSLPDIALGLIPYLLYTPGYLFYYIFSGLPAVWLQIVTGVLLLGFISWTVSDMTKKRMDALRTPSHSTVQRVETSYLAHFIKWLGPEGGKFVYTVVSHKYSKMQLFIVYLIVVLFLSLVNDGLYITGVYLSAIPMTWILIMLTNMFGFENRELLLSMQFPKPTEMMIRERIRAALKMSVVGSAPLLVLIPLFVEPLQLVLQFFLGILFVSLVFTHLGLSSCFHNYKKIEEVGLMSVSNPVLPASITFLAIIILIFCGIIAFIVVEGYIWFHILVLATINIVLAIGLRSRLKDITKPFNKNVLPELWNEL